MYDSIVIGSGFAGAVAARELAERKGQKVLVVDARDHIGGNCYDRPDEYGILIHQYGPHIFHTNSERVYRYLSRFTEWYEYRHEVVGNIYGRELPIPFNLNTLEMVYGERAPHLEKLLVDNFGEGARVPILELMNHENEELQEIAQYVYENIFLKYTMKQWGKSPKEIDPAVSGRVPVLLSRDNRYFQDTYQGLPLHGFTPVFEKLLDLDGIDVRLNCEAKTVLAISPESEQPILFEGKPFTGNVIFTGALDELFDCRFGRLPYRSLRFDFEHYDRKFYQSHGVINYTVSEDYTRITEFKYLSGQLEAPDTTIVKEYPMPYQGESGEIPYYAINNEENDALFARYKALVDKLPNFYLLGRLAEYKYYNIDAIVERALEMTEKL
ncbi:MAG: UDP-galactopyranose mutase [Lachnospiraceae bacterium]|nr:UDP-galactopyranose mutase [Lachnospiraceae bacterium]